MARLSDGPAPNWSAALVVYVALSAFASAVWSIAAWMVAQ
jgi:hypothetical protein